MPLSRDSGEAERLYSDSLGAGRAIPFIIVTDASQSPAVIDGGTVKAMMERIWAAGGGRKLHDKEQTPCQEETSCRDWTVWRRPDQNAARGIVVVTNEAETERAEQEHAPSGDPRQLCTVFIPWTKSEPMRHAG